MDNWSLRKKCYNADTFMNGSIQNEFVYTKKDIDILRKKLIDDLKPLEDLLLMDETPKFIKNIVNRRFGV